jgi:hypothetical protein
MMFAVLRFVTRETVFESTSTKLAEGLLVLEGDLFRVLYLAGKPCK